jgi:hypothetical protein
VRGIIISRQMTIREYETPNPSLTIKHAKRRKNKGAQVHLFLRG